MRQYFQYFVNGAFNKCFKNAEVQNPEKMIIRTFSKATLRGTLYNFLIRHVFSQTYCVGQT